MIPKGAGNDEWITPEWVWEPWHQVLHFVIDAAAKSTNYIKPAKLYYYCYGVDPDPGVPVARKPDGLNQDWADDVKELGGGSVWCNPPYSRKGGPLVKWVQKAMDEADKGVVCCMLLPSDTSTNWFSLLWSRSSGSWNDGVQGYFTDQRIKFLHPETRKPTGSPTFGSLIAVISKPYSNALK